MPDLSYKLNKWQALVLLTLQETVEVQEKQFTILQTGKVLSGNFSKCVHRTKPVAGQ